MFIKETEEGFLRKFWAEGAVLAPACSPEGRGGERMVKPVNDTSGTVGVLL